MVSTRILRDFRSIRPDDYQRVIRFYEAREEQIGRLDVGDHFELTARYVDALFHTGAYRKHLLMVESVLRASILYNIVRFDGRDIYRSMLFRKAASHFRLRQYQPAAYLLRELIRMKPANEQYRAVLRSALYRGRRDWLRFGSGTAIFCVLLSALVIIIELFAVRPFYPMYVNSVEWLRNDLLLFGLIAYGGTHLAAWIYADRDSRTYQNRMRKRQNRS
ncbi:MAG: hypothetical protein WBA17_02455 [Saprospiraceae bacterium]